MKFVFMHKLSILSACQLLIIALCTAGCSGLEKKDEPQTLKGTLESKAGIKHVVNCHCSTGYIVTNDQGAAKWACFEDAPPASCKSATLSGIYQESTINPSPMDPCPAGSRTLFMVKSYSCN